MLDPFPLSTADGQAFCNRTLEIEHLSRNFETTRPTLITSPRRYGKTSLSLRALTLNKTSYAYIDLYKEISEEGIEKAILNGLGQLLGQLETKPKQLLQLANDFFSDMRLTLSLDKSSLSIEKNEKRATPAENIQNALEKLEKLAKKRKRKIAFFIDEFQKLAEIANDYSIEAAIRHAAQNTKHVFYLFSGSNRHLIENMFYNSNRPLYKLCDTIPLDRIAETHYEEYIKKASKKQWGKSVEKKTIDTILFLTKRHSYYVNLLCSKLWLSSFPDVAQVRKTWQRCQAENQAQISKEVDLLGANQRKLLIVLSQHEPVKKPTSKDFLKKANMSSTSLSQALHALIEKDYVYKNPEGAYYILDPLLQAVLS